MGVFRNGTWFLDANGNGAWDKCQQDGGLDLCLYNSFGQAGDLPAVGNWDGGANSSVGVLRSGTGQWFIDRNGNGKWDGCGVDGCYVGFGMAGDLPVTGDWNGTGFAKIGVFRNGQWFLDANGNGAWDGCGTDLCLNFGQFGDWPVEGNWDGGLKAGVGVFRAGTWYLDYNGNGKWDGCQQDGGLDQCLYNSFGQAGDLPAAGDWNGDGKAKVGVFRNGTWYLDYNGNGKWDGCSVDRCYEGSFGQQGDLPVAGRFGQNVSTYTVTATAGANGSITPASRTVSKGATTTFTVTPNSGYTASVSGCGGTLSGTTYTTGAITVACPVIATFNQNVSTYALTVSKAGTGSGTVTGTGINCGSDCTESYASGTSVILTATADTGSTFAGWNGACSGTGNCMLTMSAVKSAAATFNTTTQNCDVEPCYYITQTGDTEVPVIFRSAISDAYLALQFDERNQNYNGAVFYSESVERISLSFDPKSGMLYNLNIGDEYFLFSNYTQSTVDVIKADVNGVSIAVNIPVPTHLLSFERLEMSTIRPFAGSNDEKTAEWVRKGRDLAIDALEKISKNGNYTVRDAAIDALKEFADTFPYEVTGVSKENADRVRKIISLIGSISTRAACTIGLNPWSCMSYLLNKSDIDRTIDAFTD